MERERAEKGYKESGRKAKYTIGITQKERKKTENQRTRKLSFVSLISREKRSTNTKYLPIKQLERPAYNTKLLLSKKLSSQRMQINLEE